MFSYLLFIAPALLFALWAQHKVRSTFEKYAQVPTRRGINGVDVARLLTRNADVKIDGMGTHGLNVGLSNIAGALSDHYDPRTKTVALSETSVMNSVASVAVVAHEFGHAVQDAESYGPLKLRGAIVPAIQVSSWVAPIMFMAGWLLRLEPLIWVGIVGFAAMALFSIITLPVELDASRRALVMLQSNNVLDSDELGGAKKVLDAAALTYIAAAAQSIMTLLYYLTLLTGNRRRS